MSLDRKDLLLLLWLTREVARLHAQIAGMKALLDELQIVDPRLEAIDARGVQVDAWQEFFEKLEDLDPAIAALVDSATDREPPADPPNG